MGAHLTELEQRRRKNSKTIERSESFIKILGSICQQAREQKVCPTCERAFSSTAEVDAFLSKKERELQQLPGSVTTLKREMEELEAKLAGLKVLEPVAAR